MLNFRPQNDNANSLLENSADETPEPLELTSRIDAETDGEIRYMCSFKSLPTAARI